MKNVRKFINSIYFIILINIITLICWYFETQYISYVFYTLFASIVILTNSNRYQIAGIILSAILSFQIDPVDYLDTHRLYLRIMLPVGIVGITIFVYDIIKRKVKFKHNLVMFTFIALIGANILSLINVSGKDLFFVSILGVLQLIGFFIIYFYFINSVSEDSKTTMSKIALITGLTITVQLLIHYTRLGGVSNKGDHDLTWAVSNTIAMFYGVLIPIGLYNYFIDQRKYYIILLSGFNFIMMLFMLSRGAYMTLGVIFIPSVILGFKIVEDKYKLFIHFMISGLVALGIFVIIGHYLGLIDSLINYLKNLDFFKSNGRKELITAGLELFRTYPIFGAGSYSGAYYLKGMKLGTYHNYVIETAANTGILGLLAFSSYVLSILKKTFNKEKYNLSFLISFIYILIHGIVDNTFYNPIIMLFLSLALPLIEEHHEDLQGVNINKA